MKILLVSAIALGSFNPAFAHHKVHQSGYSETTTCFREEYREEYVPGTEESPGYVRSWKETIELPCEKNTATITTPKTTVVERHYEVDDNDCTDGKIAGGILGGGLAAAVSRGDGRWWAIPLGVVAGSKIGCDAAGG